MNTNEEIKLKELLKQITPLPWIANDGDNYGDVTNSQGWVALTSGSLPDVKSRQQMNAYYIALSANSLPELVEALENMTERYVGLINSGDAGNWNPEKELEVIAARKALAKARTITQ